MALINIAGKSYELILENKSGWNAEAFRNRYSEVLERYDYIVGDWGYEQLRLKGFFKDGSNKATKESVFSFVVDYINEYCNFGCAYFVLEKKSDHGEQSATEDIDPLLADLDQDYDDEEEQGAVHTSRHEDSSSDSEHVETKSVKPQGNMNRHQTEKQPQQQKVQDKAQDKSFKRRSFKQRPNKNANNNNSKNNSANTAEDAVKEPSKKNKRRPNRPFRHFDRKKNKEQVSSTQE